MVLLSAGIVMSDDGLAVYRGIMEEFFRLVNFFTIQLRASYLRVIG